LLKSKSWVQQIDLFLASKPSQFVIDLKPSQFVIDLKPSQFIIDLKPSQFVIDLFTRKNNYG